MKLHLILFFNVVIKAFTTPNFTDLDPEVAATQLERSIVLNADDVNKVLPYKNLDMYYIGDFDDQTGEITVLPKPKLLFSPRELLLDIKAKKIAEAENKLPSSDGVQDV